MIPAEKAETAPKVETPEVKKETPAVNETPAKEVKKETKEKKKAEWPVSQPK